jgi:hypothetical protein
VNIFYPVTPGGTVVTWLASKSREEAIAKLLEDAKHMPYKNWADFEHRGYTIICTDLKRQDQKAKS